MSAAREAFHAPFHLRAKALGTPPAAFFVGLLEHEKRIGELLLQGAEVARMTAEAQQKRVAYIEAFLRKSEASNVTMPARARVEATPPPPPRDSEASARPQQALAGSSGWTPERREALARRNALRKSERSKTGSAWTKTQAEVQAKTQAEVQAVQAENPSGPSGPSGPRAVSGISSLSVSSQNLSYNPSFLPSSSGSSSPREAQAVQAETQARIQADASKRKTQARHKPEPEEGGRKEGFTVGLEEEEEGRGPATEREEDRPTVIPGGAEASEIGRAVGMHVALYVEGVRRAFGGPWRPDEKGERQAVEILPGEVFGGYLDGATVAEARNWYREQTAGFVAHQLQDRPDLKFFRPQQFLAWLHRHGPIPHAAAERRKAAHLATQRALRAARGDELPDYTITLTDDATKSLADTLLGSLAPLGSLRTGAAVRGECTRVDPGKRRAEAEAIRERQRKALEG